MLGDGGREMRKTIEYYNAFPFPQHPSLEEQSGCATTFGTVPSLLQTALFFAHQAFVAVFWLQNAVHRFHRRVFYFIVNTLLFEEFTMK